MTLGLASTMGLTTLHGAAASDEDPRRTVVDVTEFGADPTGVSDSAAAVRAALEHAATVDGPTEVVFPTGTYQLYPDKAPLRELYVSNTTGADQNYKDKRIAMLVEDMDDVVVDGGGSRLVLHGEQTIFAAIDSSDVTFRDFSTQWVAPRTLDLTVVDAGTSDGRTYRDVRVPDGYDFSVEGTTVRWAGERSPYTGEPYWTDRNAFGYQQVVDLATGRSSRGSWDGVSTNPFHGVTVVDDLGDRRLRLVYDAGTKPPPVGRVFQMRRTHRDTPGGFLWQSERTTVRDVEFGHLHGFGIVAQFTRDVTLDALTFRAGPESWRTSAASADLVQVSGGAGRVSITNSDFGFAHDDPINIHGTYVELVSVDGLRTATFAYRHHETAGFPQFYPGDELALVDKSTLRDVAGGTATVTSVDGPTGTDHAHDLTTMTVTFDRDLPAGIVPGQVVAENLTYTPEVEVRGNHFESVPTRGILVTTRRPVRIEDNTFDQMGMASIYVSADASSWYESGPVRDLVVRGNTFTRAASPVIWFDPTSAGNDPAVATHENVLIEENTFVVDDATLVRAKSVAGLTFRRNTVVRDDVSRSLTLDVDRTRLGVGERAVVIADGEAGTASSPLFRFQGSRDVVISDNRYDAGFNRRVDIVSMPAANVRVADGGFEIGADAHTDGLGTVGFTSSDPEVLTVDPDGVVTAHSPGTAQIRAVATSETGATSSAPRMITVEPTGPAPTSLTLEPATAALSLPDARLAITADTTQPRVTWAVSDLRTGKPADKASVTADGVFTATAPGVYEVTARAGGATATSLVSVDRDGAPGPHGLASVRPDDGRTGATADGALRLQSAGGTLWGTNDSARNLRLVPDGGLDVGESAVVRMEGRTASGYEEAGLILYGDDANYVAVQRKHGNGSPALRVVTEVDGAPDESRSVPDPTSEAVWLRLTRTAEGLVGEYSVDGASYTPIGSPVPGAAGGVAGRVGVLAAGELGETTFDFSGMAVGGVAVPLVRPARAPRAVQVTSTPTPGVLEAAWEYTDPDGDAQSGTLVRWYVREDGAWRPFATGSRVEVPPEVAGLPVRAVVVPIDQTGSVGAPSTPSEPVEAAGSVADPTDVSLRAVQIGNATRTGSGAWVTGPHVGGVTVDARPTNPDARVEVLVDGEPVAPSPGRVDVVVPLDAGTTTVEVRVTAPSGASASWPQTIERRRSRNAHLAEAELSVSFPGPETARHQVAHVAPGVDRFTARFVPAADGARVVARVDGRELAPRADGTYVIPVHRGASVLEVWVTAPDGATTRIHRWVTLSERKAAPFMDVTATARCIGDRPAIAVRARNADTAPLDNVTLRTDVGTRSVADVAPGASVYQSFVVRGAGESTGTVLVEVTADGVTHVLSERYDGTSCG